MQRVLIASATLNSDKISKFFSDAPVLRVPGRRFPVTIHHALKPSSAPGVLLESALELVRRDCISEIAPDIVPRRGGLMTAVLSSQVLRLHAERPAGPDEDILVFCTGQVMMT